MGQVLKLDEAEIAALDDPNPAMLEAAKKQHPALADVPTFADYHDMLNSVPLDAVEISTPHTLHREQILATLGKGLHVLCEKPLVCAVEHAHEVIAKLNESGKV